MKFKPQEISQSIKFAFNNAKEKIAENKFGSLITLSAIVLFSTFVFLALIAPLAYNSNGLIQSFVSIIPFIGILAAIIIGAYTLLKVWNNSDTQENKTTIAESALKIAINEAIESGLMFKAHNYSDCLMGSINKRAIASFNIKDIHNYSISVVRIRPSFEGILMILPVSKPWPYKLPTNKKLKAIITKDSKEAWGDCDLSALMASRLEKAYEFAKAGGHIPFFYIANNTAVLRFETTDIGSVSLIAQEFINSICDFSNENSNIKEKNQ